MVDSIYSVYSRMAMGFAVGLALAACGHPADRKGGQPSASKAEAPQHQSVDEVPAGAALASPRPKAAAERAAAPALAAAPREAAAPEPAKGPSSCLHDTDCGAPQVCLVTPADQTGTCGPVSTD